MDANGTACLVSGIALVAVLSVIIVWYSSGGDHKEETEHKDVSGSTFPSVPAALRPPHRVGYPDPSREDIYPGAAPPPYGMLETPRQDGSRLEHFYGKEDRETMALNVPSDCAHFPCSMLAQTWYPSLGSSLAPGTLTTLGQIGP